MPIFEYSCKDCGAQFEELVFADTDDVVCETCGSANTAKLMSCCGFKTGDGSDAGADATGSSGPQYRGVGSGCSGCSGGNCSSCG